MTLNLTSFQTSSASPCGRQTDATAARHAQDVDEADQRRRGERVARQ